MLATHKRLGVLASLSRLGVRNDSLPSDALFRVAKDRLDFPHEVLSDLALTSAWVSAFGRAYNHDHWHSAIRFVTQAQ